MIDIGPLKEGGRLVYSQITLLPTYLI